jgi:hypothetical protein
MEKTNISENAAQRGECEKEKSYDVGQSDNRAHGVITRLLWGPKVAIRRQTIEA